MRIEKAYAKINAYLNVVSRRADGYHNIVSVMQTVSLHDLVFVDFEKASKKNIELSTVGNDAVPNDERNLAWKAASAFLARAGCSGLVRIRIEKNIPMEAGLAGGSADAAAVLRALYALCEHDLSLEDLCKLGASLGADVPFCILGGACLVEGIGDVLHEAPSMPQGHLVVARMGDGVSTPYAYGELDRIYGDFSSVAKDDRFSKLLHVWEEGNLSGSVAHFFNLFESVVAEQRPCVNALISAMKEAGAIHAMMSGSGPSVFGVFPSAECAKSVCEQLRTAGAVAFVCTPIEKYSLN